MALSIEQQVMAYLIQCAIERRTTTYEEVAERFDLPTTWPRLSQTVSPILYRIYDWCEKKRLPKLTVLVVRKSGADMALPGRGFWAVSNLPHIGRHEKVLLTEMWVADVYNYFTVPNIAVDAHHRADMGFKPLKQENAYRACLELWTSMGNNIGAYTNAQVEQIFNDQAAGMYGPSVIRATIVEKEVVFEFFDGIRWERLRMDLPLIREALGHGN
jgi:hypothetical protein